MKRRLAEIEKTIENAAPLTALHLAQERLDSKRNSLGRRRRPTCRQSKRTSSSRQALLRQQGISYAAWREAGVPADVLSKAGVARGA